MSHPTPDSSFPKVLRTERLTLTLLDLDSPDQFQTLADIMNGDDGGPDPWTAERVRLLTYSVMLKPEDTNSRVKEGHGIYLVHVGSDEKSPAVGCISLCRRVHDVPVDLGYAFLADYRNSGYGTESATRVLNYFRDDVGIQEICIVTGYDNIPARKLAEKLRFVDGGWVDFEGGKAVAYVLPGMKKLDGQKLTFFGDGKAPGDELPASVVAAKLKEANGPSMSTVPPCGVRKDGFAGTD